MWLVIIIGRYIYDINYIVLMSESTRNQQYRIFPPVDRKTSGLPSSTNQKVIWVAAIFTLPKGSRFSAAGPNTVPTRGPFHQLLSSS